MRVGTDSRPVRALSRVRGVLLTFAVAAAIAPPWPGAVPRARAAPSQASGTFDGRIVRRLDIVSREIFDPLPERGSGFYAFANRLHVRTRASTVRGALVFREGTPWSESRRSESERLLRSLAFLVPDSVLATEAGAESVDVRVVTHDNWTTSPEFGVERGGGQHFSSFSFIERNFLGLGTSLALSYRNDVSGISRLVEVADDQLFGSHWRGRVAASRGSSGRSAGATLGLPFWAEDAPRSYGGEWQRDRSGADLFSGGRLVGRIEGLRESAAFSWGTGRAAGGNIRRLVASFELRDHALEPATLYPGAPAGFASAAREKRSRMVAGELRLLRPRYLIRHGIELMDRAEDIDIGRSLILKAGFAPRRFGSTADEGFAKARLELGHDAGRGGFGLVRATAQTYVGRAPHETQGSLDARWVQQPRERWTAVVAVAGLAGREMPPDFQLTIGGLSGLRAYSVHELTGTEAWRANAELRWIGVRDLLGLVSLGGAAFWDAGRTWGLGSEGRDWQQNAGFGLRLSLPHAALNAVARFDVAWPVAAGAGGRKGPAYSFGSGQAF